MGRHDHRFRVRCREELPGEGEQHIVGVLLWVDRPVTKSMLWIARFTVVEQRVCIVVI